ncbi:MAG: hypothetical protein HC809_07355 [Gammaproteobacteria bacterium]|nr:hypothetical protein [Gammaproteobacteria bacterium]
MIYVNALIGVVLLLVTALQFDDLHPVRWALVYFAGASLSLLSTLPRLSLNMIRFLACATTAMLFFYFAGFFLLVPGLEADWYLKPHGGDAQGLLFAGFAMIPVLSAFSCRMKSERDYAHRAAGATQLPPLVGPPKAL